MDTSTVQEMNDATLVAAWTLAHQGRQYDGVRDDKDVIADEMARRLKS